LRTTRRAPAPAMFWRQRRRDAAVPAPSIPKTRRQTKFVAGPLARERKNAL
jgi:hypothetical protein